MEIKRNANWYRPYHANGADFEKIVFYGEGTIYLTVDRGWLEYAAGMERHGADVIRLDLPCDKIARANKENLNRSDCYFMVGRRQYNFDKSYTLYIPIKPEDLGEFLAFETDDRRCYYRAWSIPMSGTVRDALGGEHEVTSIRETKWARDEKTPIGATAEKLSADFAELGVKVSDYDLVKVLQRYDVVAKSR